jgi:hypothetical protein
MKSDFVACEELSRLLPGRGDKIIAADVAGWAVRVVQALTRLAHPVELPRVGA